MMANIIGIKQKIQILFIQTFIDYGLLFSYRVSMSISR